MLDFKDWVDSSYHEDWSVITGINADKTKAREVCVVSAVIWVISAGLNMIYAYTHLLCFRRF